MIATSPAPKTESAESRRPWSPDANDHLVFHLAKFGGQKQDLVARMLGISQPTVSRIIDRYERWQAHADPREGGRLDPAERLRAQRWLTYERNELILASALRIADAMEGFTELSKSVVSRPASQFPKETEIRSESATIDRHGIAARFLRLAFRINMEQLKLVSQEAPPMPEPLTAEEIAQQEAEAAAAAAEFEAVQQAHTEGAHAERRRIAEEQRAAEEMAEQDRQARDCVAKSRAEERQTEERQTEERQTEERQTAERQAEERPATNAAAQTETAEAAAIIQPVNEMNKRCGSKSGASHDIACICAADAPPWNLSPAGSPAPATASCSLGNGATVP